MDALILQMINKASMIYWLLGIERGDLGVVHSRKLMAQAAVSRRKMEEIKDICLTNAKFVGPHATKQLEAAFNRYDKILEKYAKHQLNSGGLSAFSAIYHPPFNSIGYGTEE